MRLDTANRSFLAVMALVIAASVVIVLLGCCVIGVATYRLSTDGLGGLTKPGTLPALVLLGMLAIGGGRANRVLRTQLLATRRLARRVRGHVVQPAPYEVVGAAARAGLGGRGHV